MPDMTPSDLRATRHALGLSAAGLATLLGVQDGRTVRRWEAGEREIPGPVHVLLDSILQSRAVRRYFGLSLPEDGKSQPD